MFNKSNFCHIASNNRNDQKGSVFIYKTADTLAQVTQSGYFNEKLIDINLHDLIIHVQYNPVDRTLKKSVLIVTERTLDNVETAPILDQTIGDDIDQLGDQVAGIEEKIPGAASAANQLADKAFVNDIKTAIETTIAGINTSISTLNNDLSQTNQNLSQTNQDLAQTNQDLAQASGLIAELSNSKADVVYVNEQLATKANADLSNMNASQSAKDTIVGWGIPDYSAGVDITWTNETKNITIPSGTVVSSQAYFIAPSDGMVVLHASVSNGAEIVFVNENIVESPSTNVSVNTRFPVSKGDEIRVAIVARYYNCQFFPFKGVN